MTPDEAAILATVCDVAGLTPQDLRRKKKRGMAAADVAVPRAVAALLLRQKDLSYDQVGRILDRTGGGVLRLLNNHLGSPRFDDLLGRVQAVLDGDRVDGTAPYSWGLGSRWIRLHGGPAYSSVVLHVDSAGQWTAALACADPAHPLGGKGPWTAVSTHPLVALVHAYRIAQRAEREGA